MNTDPPATSYSLLGRLRDPAAHAAARPRDLAKFVELYTPCVFRWAELSFGHDRAEDVTQDIMLKVIAKPLQYAPRPDKRFSSWLRTIVLNKGLDGVRKDGRVVSIGDAVVELAGPDAPNTDDIDHDRFLYHRALAKVRQEQSFEPDTWRAFDLHVTKGRPAEEVAAALGVSAVTVRVAKSRVLKRVRELLGTAAP